MQRGIAATKGLLAGVAAFIATSAVIVTFAVSNANPPTAPAGASDAPATVVRPTPADRPSNTTSDAGNTGTPVEPSDGSPPATAAPDPSDGSQGEMPVAPPDVTSKLDPSLTALLGRDVPAPLQQLLPPPQDLPTLELER